MRDALKEAREEMLNGDNAKVDALMQIILNDQDVLNALEKSFLETMGAENPSSRNRTYIFRDPFPVDLERGYVVITFKEPISNDDKDLIAEMMEDLGMWWTTELLFTHIDTEIDSELLAIDYVEKIDFYEKI